MKKETYAELTKRQREEFGAFPIRYAFSNEQFNKALEELDTTREECLSTGRGGYIRKTDSNAFCSLLTRLSDERKAALEDPETLTEAFLYELGNHEYGYHQDAQDTLEAVGVKLDTDMRKKCFNKARQQYMITFEG